MINPARILPLVFGLSLLAGCQQTPETDASTAGPEAKAHQYHCGLLPVTVHYREDGLTLDAGNNHYELIGAPSTSGARFRGAGDGDGADTVFWNKGSEARLTLEGRPLPACVPPATPAEPLEARGNEPFWHLTLHNRQLTLERPDRQQTTTRVTLHRDGDSHLTAVPVSGRTPRLYLDHRLCRDSMTGMPHPFRARLETDDETLEGCGGQPERLLQGLAWRVRTLAGAGDVSAFPMTIAFSTGGRISGRADCNQYHGDYQLGGEGLRIGRLAATRRGCATDRLERERRLLRQLERVDRFDLEAGGILVLRAGGEALIRATPEAEAALPSIPE